LTLAVASCAGIVLLQQHESTSRRAQLTLAEVRTDLTTLQALPWEVQDAQYGTPAQIRGQMVRLEHRVDARLRRLLRSSPPAALRAARGAVAQNYTRLTPIFTTGLRPGGWNDIIRTTELVQGQNSSVVETYRLLDRAGAVYAHRAALGEWFSRIGGVGGIAMLLGGFLFYFRRAEKTRAKLSVQARTDPLTGLQNRTAFTARVEAQDEPAGSPHAAAVLFIDLDGFKDINDVFGHHGGDAVLREIAARLESHTRAGDICARLGGDEFAVVLRQTDTTAARAFAERILTDLTEPIVIGERVARIGASIGLAVAPPGVDLETLVHWADVAMYAAKARGNGRIEVFEPRMLRGERSRVSLEQQLAAAARNGSLVVHYQPVVSLADGSCIGAEALVRWDHPDRGLLQPAEFIAAAEHIGAIVDIGEFVLRQACSDAADWCDATGIPLAVYVNVSGRQLADEQFVDAVAAALGDAALPPEQLVLELTESALLHSSGVSERLARLVARGVRIAVDDFGTGYASLTTLRSLPISTVKIDRSFVCRVLDSPSDEAVVAAIVRMAAHLGIHTIAEGVERPDQAELLERLGAECVQGHLYLRPTTALRLRAWLVARPPALVQGAEPVGAARAAG
jgi:diguanylate cyclase (GGDEF)-like protein